MTGAFAYDPSHRPAPPPTPAPDAFTIHRADVPGDVSLAFAREGIGGVPLVLLHGYPETKRIWWRNIEPLAAAGFEVIVPDLRGMGDSSVPPDDRHDFATYAIDIHTLVADHLGHARCCVAASDVGGVVATDLAHRFPGFITRQCIFNTVPPLGAPYAEAGLDVFSFSAISAGPTGDYRELQGARPDDLAAALVTPEARRLWVAGMYTSRLWGSPGAFSADDVDFMTEPFADEARLRAGWAVYQLAHGRQAEQAPLLDAVDVPTLILYGPDDHVVGPDFVSFAEVAYPNRIGPLVVPGAGHFLQWERADIFNAIVPPVLMAS